MRTRFSRPSTTSSSPDRRRPTSATSRSFFSVRLFGAMFSEALNSILEHSCVRDRSRIQAAPATRELLRLLTDSTDARPISAACSRRWWPSGELVQTKGDRFGLPDKMDLHRRPPADARRRVWLRHPRASPSTAAATSTCPAASQRSDARRPRASRASSARTAGALEGRIIRILERGNATHRRPLRSRSSQRHRIRRAVRSACADGHAHPAGPEGGAPTRRDGGGRDHALADGDAGRRSAGSSTCSATSTRRASTPRSSSGSSAFPTRTATRPMAEAVRLGRGDASATSRDAPTSAAWPRSRSTASTPAISTMPSRIEQLPNGHFWLGVHIADVSHYVEEGSALDREATSARPRCIFPERAVHMFPSELATGLCSLNPHVDRLVQSCLMEVDRHGQVVRSRIPRWRHQQRRRG